MATATLDDLRKSYERLSADTMRHGGVRLVVRAAGTLALSPGETVRLAIRPEHIHLFDAETGRRLTADT